MIKLSNGYEFDFACGSGALGFNGKGWPWEQPFRWLRLLRPEEFCVVTKTLTLDPKEGNLSLWHPWTSVRLLPNKSAVNAIGLTNPGLPKWVRDIYPNINKVAVSIKPDNIAEALAMARILRYCELNYIEVNISCPNVENNYIDIVEILKILASALHPIVLKLSFDQVNEDFIKTVEPYVEAFHAINTIPWNVVHTTLVSPLEKYGYKGCLSGKMIHHFAIDTVKRLKQMTTKPIIGGGGIFFIEDILRFKDAGASAFSIGTLFIYKPWYPNKLMKLYRNLMNFT